MMCFVKIMDLGTALFLYKATQIDQIAFRTTIFFDVNLFLTAISWVHRRWPRTYRVIINSTQDIYTDDGAKFMMHLVLIIWPEVRFFLIAFLVESVFSCFLTPFFSFINSHLRCKCHNLYTTLSYLTFDNQIKNFTLTTFSNV